MKRILLLTCAAVAALSLFSCTKQDEGPKNVDFTVVLNCEGKPLQVSGIDINIFDSKLTQFSYKSDSLGQAKVTLPEGNYTWSASGQYAVTDTLYKFNGASTAPFEVKEGISTVTFTLNKVVATSSIIIKELYCGGFTVDEKTTKTGTDGYVILYNNSSVPADASDVVFCFAAPYNGNGANKYYTDGKLLYENESWLPAYGAIWWFKSPVTIPAYSQIVVAIWGAIDHTATFANSVNLSKAEYYWMSNENITQYINAKYVAAETIDKSHYLTCSPFTTGNAWALSTSAPAFYIGKMKAAEAEAISKDSEKYDHTMGTSAAFNVVKFPQANVIDAVEIFAESLTSTSYLRFPAKINTGYAVLTNKIGHTTYRNVDKAATEALAENAGKLVTGYTADPSGIDAEKSIKNGAHIVYMDTNSSEKDFHQREVASIK